MLRSQELFIFIVPLPGDTVLVPNDNIRVSGTVPSISPVATFCIKIWKSQKLFVYLQLKLIRRRI